jgi:hypothetical protein
MGSSLPLAEAAKRASRTIGPYEPQRRAFA